MADRIESNNATGIPVRFVDQGDGTFALKIEADVASATINAARAGVSQNGSVGAASAQLIAATTFVGEVTIQNTHLVQTLSVSFTNPATTSDFTIQPGAALTMHFGPTNALYGIGSGAATTWAAIGA